MAQGGLGARRHRFDLAEVAYVAPGGERRTIYTEAALRLGALPSPWPGLADYVEKLKRKGTQRNRIAKDAKGRKGG